jgi:hypothetical protein
MRRFGSGISRYDERPSRLNAHESRHDTTERQNSQWCLIGNIVDERPYSEGGLERRRGTKHFAPGAKVYCLPVQWGDGYDQIIVIGRHRGSKHFKTMIISSSWVTNCRAKVVYNPEVLRRIHIVIAEPGRQNWKCREEVELWIALLTSPDQSAHDSN